MPRDLRYAAELHRKQRNLLQQRRLSRFRRWQAIRLLSRVGVLALTGWMAFSLLSGPSSTPLQRNVYRHETVAPALQENEKRVVPQADELDKYAKYFSDKKAALETYGDDNPYLKIVSRMVDEKGLPPYYVMLMHLTMKSENGNFDVGAKRKNPNGTFDYGLMQLNDKALEDLEKNGLLVGFKGTVDKNRLVKDPKYNIEIAMKFMRLDEKRLRHEFPDYGAWNNAERLMAIALKYHTGYSSYKGAPTGDFGAKRLEALIKFLEAGEKN